MFRMMFYLRKTRPETHSTAFNESSKTVFEREQIAVMKKLNYIIYFEIFDVLYNPEESIQISLPSSYPKLD